MLVADVSPLTLRATSFALGIAFGRVAALLADVLPARMDLTHLTHGPKRTRRNVILLVLVIACALGLGELCIGAPDASMGRASFFLLSNLVLSTMVLAAAAVDIEHMVLPNTLTLGGALLALGIAQCRPLGIVGAQIGVATALVLSVVPSFLYRKLRGHTGVGLGDAKLNLLAGAWFGAPGALFVVFGGALQAALAAGIMRVFGLSFPIPESVLAEIEDLRKRARDGDPEALALLADDPMANTVEDGEHTQDGGPPKVSLGAMRLPLGPFLVLACLEFLFFRRPIVSFVDVFLGR